MPFRLLPTAAFFAAGLSGCYVSHADFSDASFPPDVPRETTGRDDGGADREDAAPADDAALDAEADVAPCPGDDILEASELLARAAEFDGRTVRVRGTVAERGPRACTREPCFEDEPCCNDCVVQVLLAGSDGTGPRITGTGAGEPGCYGDECHLVCVPYDVGRVYVLRGMFSMDSADGGATLSVMGAPDDVCEESPPPDHRGAYRVRARSSSVEGDCARWAPIVGGSGLVFASIGDPGQLEIWQSLIAPPGSGRYSGTLEPDGSRATFAASIHWSCCDHSLEGAFPDSRAIEATLAVDEAGAPACHASFELVGMREEVPCSDTFGPDECFRAGGIYAYVGPDTGELCSCPTFDGHETCAGDRVCEGACLAEIPAGDDCSALGLGRCTMGYRWSGCYCWLEAGRTDTATCWD